MGPPGHLAIAFAAKPAAQKVPLWVLLAATEFLDLLCYAFSAFGLEDLGVSYTSASQGVTMVIPASIPWSHGLFMSGVWSFMAAALALLVFRDRRASILVGLAVFSHWLLDFVVHPPELPLLFQGSPLVGLGLWAFGPGLILSGILELCLLAGGITLYIITRRRRTIQSRGERAV
jgi:membrane-bound metal-dependent hydrolase YbcI (DUF457 family)